MFRCENIWGVGWNDGGVSVKDDKLFGKGFKLYIKEGIYWVWVLENIIDRMFVFCFF